MNNPNVPYNKMKQRLLSCLLLTLVLAFASCKGDTKTVDTDIIRNPNSAQGYDDSEKMPAITFDQDFHDFGRVSAGEVLSYSFRFTNTGNADLVISGCDASCGCTVADFPKERIAPGKSSYITVSFRSAGMTGSQMKDITVASNTQPARTRLRIAAEVR